MAVNRTEARWLHTPDGGHGLSAEPSTGAGQGPATGKSAGEKDKARDDSEKTMPKQARDIRGHFVAEVLAPHLRYFQENRKGDVPPGTTPEKEMTR